MIKRILEDEARYFSEKYPVVTITGGIVTAMKLIALSKRQILKQWK
jgi:hypothetical protein